MTVESKKIINIAQLVLLAFLARNFSVLTFHLNTTETLSGTDALVGQLFSFGFLLLLMIPIYFLFRKNPGNNLIDCGYSVSPILGRVLGAFFTIYCLLICIHTVARFTFFMTSAVYVGEQGGWFAFLFTCAAAYAVYIGVQALSRFGIFVFIVTQLSFLVILLLLMPKYDLSGFVVPFTQGVMPVVKGGLGFALNYTEIILFLLLASVSKGSLKKGMITFAVMSVVIGALLSFAVHAVMGQYAATQMFPYYTLTSITEVSIWQRLDSLHLVTWIFTGFIRLASFYYCTVRSMEYILPHKVCRFSPLLLIPVVSVAGYLLSVDVENFNATWLSTGMMILFIIAAVALPLLLWFMTGRRKTQKGEGTA